MSLFDENVDKKLALMIHPKKLLRWVVGVGKEGGKLERTDDNWKGNREEKSVGVKMKKKKKIGG